MNDEELVAALTARLGLPEGTLKPDLALQALRHGSYVHERPAREQLRSNERLEFLGDAVLGFLIARRFYDRLPDAAEGDLTRLRASLVREESLAVAARELRLGELLLLGRSEERGNAREHPARLADAFEAVLAAVYLSCGMDAARDVLERVMSPLFEQGGSLIHDSKTELQHRFQSRRRSPQYRVLGAEGPPHARSYEVEVCLDGTALARGTGKSKKEAEQAAARAALSNPSLLDEALLDEPVTLLPWDPRWPELAREEIARLKGILTEVRIEHVGSTAVAGLLARPVIDLLITPAVTRVPDYEACGNGWFRRRGAAAFDVYTSHPTAPALRDRLAADADAAAEWTRAREEALEQAEGSLFRYRAARAEALARILSLTAASAMVARP